MQADDPVGKRVKRNQRQEAGRNDAFIQRAHDVVAGAEPHEERANDRGHDAGAGDGERKEHERGFGRAGEIDRGENHGGHGGDGEGFEQVGRHAGAVAHIVADIVGDGGRVAWIVLRNAGFHLADHIAAHVGAFGEDAAAKACEDRNQRRAEAECHQRVGDDAALRFVVDVQAETVAQERVVAGHAQEAEPNHQHPGHRA